MNGQWRCLFCLLFVCSSAKSCRPRSQNTCFASRVAYFEMNGLGLSKKRAARLERKKAKIAAIFSLNKKTEVILFFLKIYVY